MTKVVVPHMGFPFAFEDFPIGSEWDLNGVPHRVVAADHSTCEVTFERDKTPDVTPLSGSENPEDSPDKISHG